MIYTQYINSVYCQIKLCFNINIMLIADIKNKSTIVGLLYHASMDDKVKVMFTNTDCIPMVNVKIYEILI